MIVEWSRLIKLGVYILSEFLEKENAETQDDIDVVPKLEGIIDSNVTHHKKL